MKLIPKNNESVTDELTPLQKVSRVAAISLAFVGIFVWFFKILFF